MTKLTKAERAHQRKVMERRRATEKHLQMSWADWQTKKRCEWRDVRSALERFQFGAAYTPVGSDLYEIQKAVARIDEAMAEDWVCW